jgi:hypothetical protein
LRRTLATRGIDRAILRSSDETAVVAAFDSWRDGSDRLFVVDDGSGVVELRRAHPELPVLLSLPEDDVGRLFPSHPPPGVLVELEREWPSFVRPSGMAVRPMRQEGASGGAVLLLGHVQPGAQVALPFEVASPGDVVLRVDATAGPDQGDYALELDGVPLARWAGYAPEPQPRRGEASRRTLLAGRHWLVARCEGKAPASLGYDARLDALVGEAVER